MIANEGPNRRSLQHRATLLQHGGETGQECDFADEVTCQRVDPATLLGSPQEGHCVHEQLINEARAVEHGSISTNWSRPCRQYESSWSFKTPSHGVKPRGSAYFICEPEGVVPPGRRG